MRSLGDGQILFITVVSLIAVCASLALALSFWFTGYCDPHKDVITGDSVPEPSHSQSDIQIKWNGTWYGYLWIQEAFGEWTEYQDHIFDAFMEIEVSEDHHGALVILLGNKERLVVDALIIADNYHIEVTKGHLWGMTLDPENWWLGLSPVDQGKLIVISDTYLDQASKTKSGFEFQCEFRPLGDLWHPAKSSFSVLPPNYEEYAKKIKSQMNTHALWPSDQETFLALDNAGLPLGTFSSDIKTISGAGLKLAYPALAQAKVHIFQGILVKSLDEFSLSAVLKFSQANLTEIRNSLEKKQTKEELSFYESTYRGSPCLVSMQDTAQGGTCTIWIFIAEKRHLVINVHSNTTQISEMLKNQDLLATISSVSW